jgi:hypothetical protein
VEVLGDDVRRRYELGGTLHAVVRGLWCPLYTRDRARISIAPCAPLSESALTLSAIKTSGWLVHVLHRKSGDRERRRAGLMADRRAAAPATAHGVACRLLVFKLPDQLALCFAESAGDVRVRSDRY